MSGKEEEVNMDLLAELIKLLGLDEGATPEAVIEKVTEVQKAAEKPEGDGGETVAAKAVLEALDLEAESTESEVVASIHALKQGADEQVVRVAIGDGRECLHRARCHHHPVRRKRAAGDGRGEVVNGVGVRRQRLHDGQVEVRLRTQGRHAGWRHHQVRFDIEGG